MWKPKHGPALSQCQRETKNAPKKTESGLLIQQDKLSIPWFISGILCRPVMPVLLHAPFAFAFALGNLSLFLRLAWFWLVPLLWLLLPLLWLLLFSPHLLLCLVCQQLLLLHPLLLLLLQQQLFLLLLLPQLLLRLVLLPQLLLLLLL